MKFRILFSVFSGADFKGQCFPMIKCHSGYENIEKLIDRESCGFPVKTIPVVRDAVTRLFGLENDTELTSEISVRIVQIIPVHGSSY